MSFEVFNLFAVDANNEANRFNWGDLRDRIVELLTAHYLAIALAATKKSLSQLQSLKVDDESYEVHYSSGITTKTDYQTTIYGSEYSRLLQQRKDSPTTSTALYKASTRSTAIGAGWLISGPRRRFW